MDVSRRIPLSEKLPQGIIRTAARVESIQPGEVALISGDGTGAVNSLTIPSMVAPTYAPAGWHLVSVVVIDEQDAVDESMEDTVRQELTGWFGSTVDDWRRLKTYGIQHALPQPPPMPDPTVAVPPLRPGFFVCGEYGSVPGIQWAMLSGRQAAEQVLNRSNSIGPANYLRR